MLSPMPQDGEGEGTSDMSLPQGGGSIRMLAASGARFDFKGAKVGTGSAQLSPPFPRELSPYPAPLPFPSGINQEWVDWVSFALPLM